MRWESEHGSPRLTLADTVVQLIHVQILDIRGQDSIEYLGNDIRYHVSAERVEYAPCSEPLCQGLATTCWEMMAFTRAANVACLARGRTEDCIWCVLVRGCSHVRQCLCLLASEASETTGARAWPVEDQCFLGQSPE